MYCVLVSTETSRLRQRLAANGKRLHHQLEMLLGMEQGALIRGSFGTRSRVCGVSNCRCTRGELHTSKFLSASDGGTVRQVHVPAGDEVEVAAGVDRYRRFRKRRSEFAAMVKEQLELLDSLGRSLLRPYPPDAPLPPPQKRGRKPKGVSATER